MLSMERVSLEINPFLTYHFISKFFHNEARTLKFTYQKMTFARGNKIDIKHGLRLHLFNFGSTTEFVGS